MSELFKVIDLGVMGYEQAFEEQLRHHERVLGQRNDGHGGGVLLLVEHPPVITISNRKGAGEHLLASEDGLKAMGVQVCPTNRGGDITYHGPGQLVAYLIIDLNRHHLKLHGYMRLLEEAVIRTCHAFGIVGVRDSDATGVWVPDEGAFDDITGSAAAKICAMGVRVSRWVTMHGLAINVTTNLEHFSLIVPCGLPGRGVTSFQAQLGEACPAMDEVKKTLVLMLQDEVGKV